MSKPIFVIDLDDPQTREKVTDWCGVPVCAIELRGGGRKCHVHVSVEGRERDLPRKAKVITRFVNQGGDVTRNIVARPWIEDDES